ncbi:solute carrier family 39 (zinc transporter) member 9 [Cryptococcus deuterogattii R265]|uniref:Solute carrier family 39 (Zinc transporter) member 9 n=1 Tax=Cryptococcus deuterogattii (strain R265) TaxID=294750 RepID=A0A095ERR0_CRYD2|nr:solute carrier family 39 (zinc transporter) member 9 [Cryptococcus deuterogattii R265]KIR73689.1 solute carrier family 39 (zinc transporter), member 9 [Cryptococcus deuterogattii CA1014]KIR99556.1 solute carrier family 39 (zinc transporter), member 9 [Cryptococcus deuterogattii 2001/935-1]
MPILLLLLQSAAMFAASFLVGIVPLSFKSASSGRTLKAISVMGMGLLVGAALTIIIPEGVATLYSAIPQDGNDHDEEAIHAIGLGLLSGFSLMLLIESLIPHESHQNQPSSGYATPSPPGSPISIESSSRPPPQHLNSHTPIVSKPKRMSVDESESEAATQMSSIHGLNATLGLVIHGAADGIALGASSLASGKKSLSLIVFLAVLVHKGPTALGLTTTLLSLGLPISAIRERLIIFSFAAPVGAILTFTLVSAFGNSKVGGTVAGVDALGWWTGVALLFSGGSFLYVATVIQPLSSHDAHSQRPHHLESGHGPDDYVDPQDRPLGKYQRTGLLVFGMGLPVILSAIVGDAH